MILTKKQQIREKRKVEKAKRAKTLGERPENRGRSEKYNWTVIKGLYMAGMDKKELLTLPECATLSDAYLSKRIYSEGWPEERRQQVDKMKFVLGAKLEDSMQGAMEAHYRFMLKEIDDERAILAKRLKTTSISDQKERIDLLIKFEGVVRKTLGLDDMTPGDKNKNAYQFILNVQNFNGSQNRQSMPSATVTLLPDQKGTTGLSEPRTGILGEELEPEGQSEGPEGLLSTITQEKPEGQKKWEGLSEIDMTAEGILQNYRMGQ